MRLKDGFVLREIAGQRIVIALGEASQKFHGMINLNETSGFIWKCIENGMSEEEITEKIVEEYEVNYEKANCDIKKVVLKLEKLGVLEDIS